MKGAFSKYLPHVLPSIFNMATLQPKMGVQGQDAVFELNDVLNEIKPEDKKETKTSIVTDEIEEKEVAIQMLSVFIDELGASFFDYVPQTAKILLSLTNFASNDSIRTTCVSALPGLVKCVKQHIGGQPNQDLFVLAKDYIANIYKSMEEETETECLCSQVAAMKEIILECGPSFLTEAEVHQFGDAMIRIINKSLDRIKELDDIKNEEVEDEDDALDKEDIELLKEEGKNEYDLQLSAAELLGALFKTHKEFVKEIVFKLKTETLKQAFDSKVQKREKFGLFVLDDLVEHLGPSFFEEQEFKMIVERICSFTSHKSAGLRQASCYGIGVIAQHSGQAFSAFSDACLTSLNGAINFQMTGRVHSKKEKSTQFHHARDNAIASLGKVLKF